MVYYYWKLLLHVKKKDRDLHNIKMGDMAM
jgi:hypothetical protein